MPAWVTEPCIWIGISCSINDIEAVWRGWHTVEAVDARPSTRQLFPLLGHAFKLLMISNAIISDITIHGHECPAAVRYCVVDDTRHHALDDGPFHLYVDPSARHV
jgi:hypothetical protein